VAGEVLTFRQRGRQADLREGRARRDLCPEGWHGGRGTTIARKRSVFANVLGYAIELEELTANPLDRLKWKPPKVSEVVDRRVVVNPRQARALLVAATYVGQQRRGPHARGQRLMALYACMYFAALRPAEAAAPRLPPAPHRVELADPGEVTAGSQPALDRHRVGAR
jgi:hypothetical protein